MGADGGIGGDIGMKTGVQISIERSVSSTKDYINNNNNIGRSVRSSNDYINNNNSTNNYMNNNNDHKDASSFASVGAYMKAVMKTPERLGRRVRAIGTAEEELNEVRARSRHDMRRKLRWYDVMGLGIGGMAGAGVFVATGKAARVAAGPAVIVSYAVAGLAALLSAFCYTELAVHVPAAGGAFSYVRITFGELAAFVTGANLIMEYVISNAAVARSFTSYLATVFGQHHQDAWRITVPGMPEGYDMVDFPAVILITVITLCICYSTKRSSTLNVLITIFHLALICVVVALAFANGRLTNLIHPSNADSSAGFFPYGVRGVFNGAAIVYYSYIGYDSVSTMAEEVHKPAKTMPIGISGSVLVVTVLYCLMAASLVVLVPYDQIDVTAAFSMAFAQIHGWEWASHLVGVGACIGILSSLLVAMLGQARYLCVIGRANVIPSCLASVNSSTGTPIYASMVLGFFTAIVALFTELDILVDLISIGTLFVFYMVANALIFRRHVSSGNANPWPTLLFLVLISLLSVGFVLAWQLGHENYSGLIICGAGIVIVTFCFQALCPTTEGDKEWEAPFMPFLAVTSIFLNVFLAGTLTVQAFRRFGIWSAATLLFYLAYSVHATHDAEAIQASKIPQTSILQLPKLLDKGPVLNGPTEDTVDQKRTPLDRV